jgi:transposase
VPKPIRGPAVRESFFGKDVFRDEPDLDVSVCPAGAALSPRDRGKSRDNVKVDYANRDACKGCSLRSRLKRHLGVSSEQ